MSRIKNMSRGGWIVIGIVLVLVLVPTGVATAAMLKYTGIEGTNGQTSTINKAQVTSAGQLLTTEAPPTSYEDYSAINVSAANGEGPTCVTVGPSQIPAGEAFVIQEIYVTAGVVNSPTTISGPPNSTESGGAVEFFVGSPGCTADDPYITSGTATAPGGFSIPLTPGYVIPSGDTIDAYLVGMGGDINITGYLVPSADAPSTPQSIGNGKMTLLPNTR
jgi:hypothetical protein